MMRKPWKPEALDRFYVIVTDLPAEKYDTDAVLNLVQGSARRNRCE